MLFYDSVAWLISAGQFFCWSPLHSFVKVNDGSSWSWQSQNDLTWMPGIDAGSWLGHVGFLPCGFSSSRDLDKLPYRMLFGFQRVEGEVTRSLKTWFLKLAFHHFCFILMDKASRKASSGSIGADSLQILIEEEV